MRNDFEVFDSIIGRLQTEKIHTNEIDESFGVFLFSSYK
jgi:hypothetical protein